MRDRLFEPIWFAKTALIVLLATVTTNAYAELLGYRFTDVYGEQRNVTPDQIYINPANDLTFYLRAGVDRRLEIELMDSDSRTIGLKLSNVLGANDRISFGGREHYGARITLPIPEEGVYSAVSRILDSNGVIIEEYSNTIVIDREEPEVTGEFKPIVRSQQYFHDDSRLFFGLGPGSGFAANAGLEVDGLRDNVGLSQYRFYTIQNDGSRRETPWFSASDKAMLQRSQLSNLFPINRQDYDLVLEVEDLAGNVSTLMQEVNYTFELDYSPLPMAIYSGKDSDVWRGMSGFKEYKDHIDVETPFTQFVMAVRKNEFFDHNIHGLMRGTHGGNSYNTIGHRGQLFDLTDNDFYYFLTDRRPITRHGPGLQRHTFGDRFGNNAGISMSYNSVEGSDLAPVISRSAIYYSDGTEIPTFLGAEDSWEVGYVDVEIHPRSYPVRVNFTGAGNAIFNPGETSKRLQVNRDMSSSSAARVGQHTRIYMDIGDNEEVQGRDWTRTFYVNKIKPVVADFRLDETSLILEVDIETPASGTGYFYNYYGLLDGEVITSAGASLRSIRMDRHSPQLHTLYFNLNELDEGRHDLKEVRFWDRFNSVAEPYSFSWVSDSTKPVVSIVSEEAIASLDEILIRVTDNIDQSPTVTNARITGGPANDDVNLATVRRSGSLSTYRLEYPVIFPSMAAGEEYQLEVTARDANGNVTVERKTFRYEPNVVSLSAENGGAIQIPARAAAFLRNDGGDVVQSEPLTLSGGAPVAGTYDVYATLRTDAEVPLIINGVRVVPGDTQEIMGQHDFSTSGGRLSIPVAPAEDGIVGTSSILVTTTAPNAPVLLVDIQTWDGEAVFSGSGWEARQVIDPLSYTASPSSSTFCRFSTRESEARQSDAVSSPTCFFEWDRLPGELTPLERRSGEAAIPALEGVATEQGPQALTYSLYMFDRQGAKVKVGGDSKTLNVTTAANAVQFAPEGDYSSINRVLDRVDLRMRQASGPECVPTLSESTARTAGERNGHAPSRRTCHFEWSQVPSGLDQASKSDVPQLEGFIDSRGDHTLRWNAYLYSPQGFRVAVAQQSHTLTAVDPDAPLVTLTSDYLHEGNTYVVPQNRTALGGLIVDGLPTEIRLDIKRGSEQIENDVFSSGWGARNRLVRNLRTGRTPVWQETLHTATAIYEKVPDIRTVGEYRVITSPSEDILPLLEMDSTTVLDTEPMKLTVKMRSMMDRDGDYDAQLMGAWRVRLLNQRTFNNQEPMTEFIDATNGDATFEIEMERLTDAGLRLVAEAELVSPIDGYERVVTSRPTFVQVLRGGAIDGEVTSRRFTGPAPLTAVFQIALEDRLDQQALGDVVWQVSTDDGATWEDQPVDPRRRMQFYQAFEEGEYLLRAFMVNRNSGAESFTEQVQVVSYTQPEVSIVGPAVLFVGDTHTYVAEVTVPENAKRSAEEAIVEWSLDAGDTWTHTGRELELTSTEEARFALRARTRMPEAPEIDRNAFDEARMMVNFRDVTAPRVRVRSYTLLEEGRPYSINASATVPYRGLEYEIKGYFTLPDGTTREGRIIDYIPTLADAEAGSATFTYTAWVDGFKEETLSTGSSTSRVWQYEWPEFYVTQRLSTDVAPAQLSMSVRHRNGTRNLDNPTYEWQLPEGIEALQERGLNTRLFTIQEPGQHPVRITVTDDRGHSTLVEHVIDLGVPNPYDITLQYTPSNSFMREPLDVRLRPTYRGGHPHDRVNHQRFLVNGDVVAEGANSAVATLTAGRHEVTFEIETNHGIRDHESIFIDVVENQIPVCELESSESVRNWIVRADCSDEDGRVRKYHWLVNGEENTRTSNRLGLLKRDYDDEMPQVILIAVDDSGGASLPVTLD